MSRLHFYAALTFLVASLLALITQMVGNPAQPAAVPAPQVPDPVVAVPTPPAEPDARDWFLASKDRCNRVELETLLRDDPAPEGPDRAGFTVACIALAGQVMRARDSVLALPVSDRAHAGDIVFEVAHPIAARDDYAAGEMMALVSEFSPQRHIAFYYAGIAADMHGLDNVSRPYLERFLQVYHQHDCFHSNAVAVLRRMDSVGSQPSGIPVIPADSLRANCQNPTLSDS